MNFRILLAVAAATLLSVTAALDLYRALATGNQADPYRVAEQQARFAGVAEAVPAGTILGYLSDLSFDETRGAAMFFGAQYALAPRLLTRLPDRDWVVGNFSQPADYAAVATQHGLELVRDFGDGVALFRRSGR